MRHPRFPQIKTPLQCLATSFQRFCLRARNNKLLCTCSLKQPLVATSRVRVHNQSAKLSARERKPKRSTTTSVGADWVLQCTNWCLTPRPCCTGHEACEKFVMLPRDCKKFVKPGPVESYGHCYMYVQKKSPIVQTYTHC